MKYPFPVRLTFLADGKSYVGLSNAQAESNNVDIIVPGVPVRPCYTWQQVIAWEGGSEDVFLSEEQWLHYSPETNSGSYRVSAIRTAVRLERVSEAVLQMDMRKRMGGILLDDMRIAFPVLDPNLAQKCSGYAVKFPNGPPEWQPVKDAVGNHQHGRFDESSTSAWGFLWENKRLGVVLAIDARYRAVAPRFLYKGDAGPASPLGYRSWEPPPIANFQDVILAIARLQDIVGGAR